MHLLVNNVSGHPHTLLRVVQRFCSSSCKLQLLRLLPPNMTGANHATNVRPSS